MTTLVWIAAIALLYESLALWVVMSRPRRGVRAVYVVASLALGVGLALRVLA